jgi:ribokinase
MGRPLIVVVGSSNTDLVLTCDRLPRPGETVLGGAFARFAGGKGANQAVAAARAGAAVHFVGARGDDDFGRAAHDSLAAEGIALEAFRVRRGTSSGIALILIGGRDRQNLIAVARSANDTVGAKDVRAAGAAIVRAKAVLCQLEIPPGAVRAAAQIATAAGVPFVLNPAPARPLPRSLIKLVHTLTPNEHEAALLSGESSPRRAAEALRRMGCRNVVVTLGAKGALVADDEGIAHVDAPRVRPVDTVGAGDCFSAWLTVGIAEGLPLRQAARRAAHAAAIAVTRPGAQASMPYRREVAASLKAK